METQGLRLIDKHINKVQNYLTAVIANLLQRLANHDRSKLSDEEIDLVVNKPKFDSFEYMAEERAAMAAVQVALKHHYTNNDHHPEFYPGAINDRSLMALLELCADWKAAGEVSANGSFSQSLDLNKTRFGISDQLMRILEATGRELGWL